MLLTVTGIYAHILRNSSVPVTEKTDLNQIPVMVNNWQSETYKIDQITRDVLKASQTLWRRYTNQNNQSVSLFIGYFKDQKYGEQIHSPKHCMPGQGWKFEQQEVIQLEIEGPEPVRIHSNKITLNNGRRKQLLLYWFWTRNGTIQSEYGLKLDLAKNGLLRKPGDAAFIRIIVDVDEHNPDQAILLTNQFLKEFFPYIQKTLPFKI